MSARATERSAAAARPGRGLAPGLVLALLPGPLLAQPTAAPPPAPPHAAPPDAQSDDEDEIVVKGVRPPQRGAVIGDIAPEEQLSPADIRSYGVSSVADLLAELAPETRSDRGRGGEAPVVLLNGRRISGLAEIRDIPTEAIQRIDILPEEVGLKYGFTADQRVVNIVLRRRFRSVTGELDGGLATEGGGANGEGQADLLRIRNDGRLNLDLKYRRSAALLDSDRDIVTTTGGAPFDPVGNIAAPPGRAGREIDPALSALAGEPVTVAAVPASAAAAPPSLADFVPGANDPNAAAVSRYRSLRPATRELTLNSVYNRTVLGTVSATLNGSLDLDHSDALQGLPGASLLLPAGSPFSPFGQDVELYRSLGAAPLTQRISTVTGHLGVTLNGALAKWIWSLTGNYDHADTRTRTARGFDLGAVQALLDADDPATNPYGPLTGDRLFDRARARADTGDVQLVASGPLLDLPAGPLSTTVKLGATLSRFRSESTRGGVALADSLSRSDGSGQLNLDLPIASRKNHVLAAAGNLSANLNLAVDRLSGFGTLTTLGYGFNWSPHDGWTLLGSVTDDHAAPTVQQLGDPEVVTPDVRVYDAIRGATADVTQIDGGNPGLLSDRRRVVKLELTVKPHIKPDLTLSANFIATRIRNAVASLPEPTVAIEAAFPERFERDAEGDLETVDARPVNIARETRTELRWGVNFSQPLKSRPNPALADAMRARFEQLRAQAQARDAASGRGTGGGPRGPNDGDRSGGGPGGGFGGGRGGGRGGAQSGGRLQIALYHTWHFRDDVLIRDGVPKLDLLDGDAIGANGGQPRHELELQLGYSNNGVGARLSGNWQSGTVINGAVGSPTGDLRFASLATANLRLFANLAQLGGLAKHGWARGLRVTLSLTNITDSREHVRDATGGTPIRYQPDALDPLGRTIRFSLRKLFF